MNPQLIEDNDADPYLHGDDAATHEQGADGIVVTHLGRAKRT